MLVRSISHDPCTNSHIPSRYSTTLAGTHLGPLSQSASSKTYRETLGGPTAAVIAFQNPNIRVTVVDKDAGRIRKWNSQHPPIHEPGLNEIVRVARDGTNATTLSIDEDDTIELPARHPNLFFSTEVAKCVSEADIVFLSVNTPTKMTGIGAGAATNMVALEGATRDIAIAAKPGAIIVEKSTVPCRTAQIVRDTVCR